MGYEHRAGHAAVAAASEALNYAGMQSRLQTALGNQIVELLKKEVALGLGFHDMGLGAAGFIASFVTTMTMAALTPEDRAKFAGFIIGHAHGMVKSTDWKTLGTEKDK